MDQISAAVELTKPEYSKSDAEMYKNGITLEERKGKLYFKQISNVYLNLFSEMAKQIIKTQNNLLKLQKEYSQNLGFKYAKFKSKQFGFSLETSKSVENDKNNSLFNIYNIQKKSKTEENLDIIALSDDDI